MTSAPEVLLAETAAIARKFKGTRRVAIVRMPLLVVGSFQRCSVYRPTPKRIAVTVVKIRNFNTGICEICAQRLTTSAVEQPMMSKPPIISPQRMLLSSMKELSTSLKGLRTRGGGAGGGIGGGGICSVGRSRSISMTTDSTTTSSLTVMGGGTGGGTGGGAGRRAGSGFGRGERSSRIRAMMCSYISSVT